MRKRFDEDINDVASTILVTEEELNTDGEMGTRDSIRKWNAPCPSEGWKHTLRQEEKEFG